VKTCILRHLIPERIPWFAVRLYDKIAGEALESYYKPVAREIVSARDQGSILDIGTGPGFLPIEIAKIARKVDLHAIDLSRRMIRLAQLHASKAGVAHRIRFRVGDGNRLPFDSETLDMVVSTGSLHSWKDPVRVINECFRVLRPGTEAWIYDPAKIVSRETENMLQTGSSLFRVGNSSGTLVGQITDSMCRAGVKDKTFGCFASLTPALAHMLPME